MYPSQLPDAARDHHVQLPMHWVSLRVGQYRSQRFQGRRVAPADGKSLVPVFRGQVREGHEVLFWKFAHGRAVREKTWKLVKKDKEPWELYDLAVDPVELDNLADRMPDKVEALAKRWTDWAGPLAVKKKSKKKRAPK